MKRHMYLMGEHPEYLPLNNRFYTDAEAEYMSAQMRLSMTPPDRESIDYWRSFPDLHKWMTRLYIKNGSKHKFDGIKIFLIEKDIDDLAISLLDKYPTLLGKGISLAKKEIRKGRVISYHSWLSN